MRTPILVTGAAGFIGMHTAARLLGRGEIVVGIDSFNAYYDPALKIARAGVLQKSDRFQLIRGDVSDSDLMKSLVKERGIRTIVHLAAQAGVRYSIDHPFDYERSNLAGHLSMLEAARDCQIDHFVYASSSSVYGDRPFSGRAFSEDDPVDRPASLYAATKAACELMSTSYSRLYGFPQSGLRFFTAYGPWGRPDMAYYSFTNKIARGEPIEVYGMGNMARDFTFIDDIVDGIMAILDSAPNMGTHEIYNIGSGRPVSLLAMISTLEAALGLEAKMIMKPMQPGDVTTTHADTSKLLGHTGYCPSVALDEGLRRFVQWWRRYDSST